MKYLIPLLILANLAVFAWLYTHQDDYRPAGPVATALPSSIEPLVLLRERGVAGTGNIQAEPEPEPMPMPEPVEVGDEPLDADGAVASTSEDTLDAADTTASAPEDGAVPDAAAGQAQTDAPQPPEPAPPAPQPHVCQTIGPFPARSAAQGFMTRLPALTEPPVMRTAQVEEPSGYWVYLPSMPRTQASRTIDDLAAKGVKDYFLGRQNVISLGIFSDKLTAENRVRDINRLGYQPQLEPRFVTREVYWVDFEERGPDYISAEQWRELLGAQPDLRRQSLACE